MAAETLSQSEPPDDVLAVLRRFFGERKPSGIAAMGGAGGLSGASFWRLEVDGRALLLRQWPAAAVDAARLARIHSLLAHAQTRGVGFLPTPLAAASGETLVARGGRLWEVTPCLPGVAAAGPPLSEEQIASATAGLAQFHLAAMDNPDSPPTVAPPLSLARRAARAHEAARAEWLKSPGHLERPGLLLRQEVHEICHGVVAALPSIRCELATAAHVRLPLQMINGDVRLGHLLFSGDRLTGLVDFGAATYDTPALDVARLLGEAAGDDPASRRAAMDAYQACRPLSADERRVVAILDRTGVALSCFNWMRWLLIEERPVSDPSPVRRRMEHLRARLAALLAEAPFGTA